MGLHLIITMAISSMLGLAGAEVYTVGDEGGWITGTNYLRWSERHNFTVGDVLVFNYVKGQHDVYQVTEDTYRSCDKRNGVIRMYTNGGDRVELTEAAKYWFICSILGHCEGGMKFGVDVASAKGSSEGGGGGAPAAEAGAAGGRIGWWGCGFWVALHFMIS